MSYWDNKSVNDYKDMHLRHKLLWNFVTNFIFNNKITSIIEVGGGAYNLISKLVKNYINIDINNSLNENIKQDFLTMDISPYVGKYDLFLSCAVIEHCNDYKEFIKRAVGLKTKFAIISFFFGLNKDKIYPEKDRDNGRFILNSYSQKTIEDALKEIGIINYRFEFNKKDAILIINNNA